MLLQEIGDNTVSPVSSGRRNFLGMDKSSWWRLAGDLKYHPYKPIRRQELKPQDLPRRLQFCQWLLTMTEAQLLEFLVSDEANFQLNGHVNSQNIRRFES